KVAIAFDVVNFDARVAKAAKAIEHVLHCRCFEFRMRDEVMKKIAVQIQRSRLQLGKTIEPVDHRSLASGREPDVRGADDEDLAGGDHEPSPAASRHRLPQAGEGLSIESARPAA